MKKLKYLRLFEELHEADMLERGFEKGELPKKDGIYYWVETAIKFDREKKMDPVKVKFDRMDNPEKNDFGHFFIEENTERWKKGEKINSDIHGLWKDFDKAYLYCRR